MLLVNDPDFRLHVGDVLEQLRELPAESVHCVVTSPPYWGLREAVSPVSRTDTQARLDAAASAAPWGSAEWWMLRCRAAEAELERVTARLDAIRRWQDWRGSGFPAGDKDGLVVVTELVSAIVLGDALAAELERVTAALRSIDVGFALSAHEMRDRARAALAGGARAAQKDAS